MRTYALCEVWSAGRWMCLWVNTNKLARHDDLARPLISGGIAGEYCTVSFANH